MFNTTLFIIARTWKQPRWPSTDRWIKKLWFIYTMGYYSAIRRNAYESVLMRWMNLEPIIQWSKSEREKYINVYTWNPERWLLMNLFTGQQWRRRHRQQTCGHREGRRGWEKLRQWHCSIYITICKTRQLVEIYYMTQGAQIWCSVTT